MSPSHLRTLVQDDSCGIRLGNKQGNQSGVLQSEESETGWDVKHTVNAAAQTAEYGADCLVESPHQQSLNLEKPRWSHSGHTPMVHHATHNMTCHACV